MKRILLLTASLGLLSACGLKGDLERPMPLWGNPPRTAPDDPRTLKEQEDRLKAEKAEAEAKRQREIEELRQQAPAPPATPTPP